MSHADRVIRAADALRELGKKSNPPNKKETQRQIAIMADAAKKAQEERNKNMPKEPKLEQLDQYVEKLVNEGFSDNEIMHMINLDESMRKHWHTNIKPRVKALGGAIRDAIPATLPTVGAMAAAGALNSKAGVAFAGAGAAIVGATATAVGYKKSLKRHKVQGEMDWEDIQAKNDAAEGDKYYKNKKGLKEASGVNADEKGMIKDKINNPESAGSLPKETKRKIELAKKKAKTLGFKEEQETNMENLLLAVSNLFEQKTAPNKRKGKVSTEALKAMSPRQRAAAIKNAKKEVVAKKAGVKPKAKKQEAAPVAQPEESGLDLITQHKYGRLMRSALANVPAVHKEMAVKWLIDNIKKHKDNHIQAFVKNPHETMQYIKAANAKKDTGPSLPKLKFLEPK